MYRKTGGNESSSKETGARMQRHQAVKSARGGDGHDDDDEPIVYYDLDAGSMRQNPLLYSPKNARGSAHATAKRENLKGKKSVSSHRSAANGILQRPREIFHQQPLFQLGTSVCVCVAAGTVCQFLMFRLLVDTRRRPRVRGREPVRVFATAAAATAAQAWALRCVRRRR